MIMEHFGLTENSKTLAKNGYKEEVITEEELAMEQLNVEEQRTHRAFAARLNYISPGQPVHPIFFKRSVQVDVMSDPERFSKDQEDCAAS